MSFGQFAGKTKQVAVNDDTVREEIKYKKISVDKKFGLNLAILGEEMHGKSLLAGMFGYFNSKYVSKLDPVKFPNCIKLLKEGYMPEVEKIFVLDLDNRFEKSCSRGDFRDLLKPLLPVIQHDKIRIPKRQTKMLNGSVVSARPEELFTAKQSIEDAIQIAVEDFGPEILFIIDSMSSYYEVLNSMFSIVYEAAFDASLFERVKNQNQWQIRNAWWAETMKKKVNYEGWQIDTVKVIRKPDHWFVAEKKKNPKASPFNIKWAEGSGDNAFNLDMIYWIKRDSDGLPYFDIVNGRYKSGFEQDNTKIYYELNKRTAPFFMIEKMAPYIMTGELKEEDLW